jgi:hypothetical protein
MGSPRLLLVTIDRLPAWILPAWGATWVSTPALDTLAGSGIVLDRLIAPTLDPRQTLEAIGGGVLAVAAAAGIAPVIVTDDAGFAESAAQATAGVVTRVVDAYLPRRAARTIEGTNPGRLFAAAREMLTCGDHRFVWVHAGSLALAWDAPESFLAPYVDPEDPPPPEGVAVPSLRLGRDHDPDLVVGYRQRFAAQVTLLDRCIGDFLAALPGATADSSGWTVCLAGVRGMALGLHGVIGVPGGDGEELPLGESIHLPAIFVDARGRMAAQRYAGLVLPADLGATLRGVLAREEAVPPAPGGGEPARSLEGLFDGWKHPPRDRVLCVAPAGTAVVTEAWSYVESTGPDGERSPRLHAKPDDYFELVDVHSRCPGVVARMAEIAAAARRRDLVAWTMPLGGQGDEPG